MEIEAGLERKDRGETYACQKIRQRFNQHLFSDMVSCFPQKVICTLLDCPAHSVVLSIVKHSSSIATLTHSKVSQ